MTVVLGIAYPLVVLGVGQLVANNAANGSLVTDSTGTVVGSELIGQQFDGPEWFAGRPSAAGDGYDAMSSGGSNLAADSPDLLALVERAARADRRGQRRRPRGRAAGRADRVRVRAGPATSAPPTPCCRSTGSPRPAGCRVEQVRELVEAHTEGRALGFIGEERVNVLKLNLALAAARTRRAGTEPAVTTGSDRPPPGPPAQAKARGRLRVYLGAAPGVGKTVDMLCEGRRRAGRGTDVVVGIVETHGREFTAEQVGDLPVVPRRVIDHRGVQLTEMDTDAVLARHPDVVLVDELAHTNAPGSAHEKRWQDVDQLLDAGIDVITTVNIQHLESLNDVVAAITGIKQTETVPDAVVRAAEQIELVDMTPQALRRRMAHGHIYPADRIDTALGNYFREGNLTALRELALLWVADRVEEGLDRYRAEHGIKGTWAARDRIVVALTGGPGGVDAAPPRRPDRRPGRRQVADRRARRALRRHRRDLGDRDRTATAARREPRRQPATHRRRRHRRDRAGVRPVGQRHPDHRRRVPARTPGATVPAERGQRHRQGLRRHRRLRGHPPPRRAITSAEDAARRTAGQALVVGGRGAAARRVGRAAAALAGRPRPEHRAAGLPARRARPTR